MAKIDVADEEGRKVAHVLAVRGGKTVAMA
jgi:hypothetical protein